MIFSAHQPNYFPWLGYFYKILMSDMMVILDDAQYARRSYQNRVQIKTRSGVQWISQPVFNSRGDITMDIQFDPSVEWRTKHLNQLKENYVHAPHFKSTFAEVSMWLNEAEGSLCDANTQLIRNVATRLGSTTKIIKSSSLGVTSMGSLRIAEIGQKIGATRYLSGQGAVAYQNEADFIERGQTLHYSRFAATPYPQLHGEFAGGLSVLDAFFNIGVDATSVLLRTAQKSI